MPVHLMCIAKRLCKLWTSDFCEFEYCTNSLFAKKCNENTKRSNFEKEQFLNGTPFNDTGTKLAKIWIIKHGPNFFTNYYCFFRNMII